MITGSDLTFGRIAAVAALVAALGLAGCGRKAGLDLPPSAAAVPTPGSEPLAPEDPSADGTTAQPTPGSGRNAKAVSRPASQFKSFFLDWLID